MKKILLPALLVLICIILSGCLPGDGKNTEENPAGFFWGFWHGIIAPFSLIVRLFKSNIRIYEVANSGWWYDLGFYLALAGGGGATASGVHKKRKPATEEWDRPIE